MLTVLWWIGIMYAIGYSIGAVAFCAFRVAAIVFPPPPARRRIYQPVPLSPGEDGPLQADGR